MIYYSVCAAALFPGLPLDQAIPKIAAAGGKAYEFWNWGGNDVEKVCAAQQEYGVKAAAMCASFEPLNVPERHEAYIAGTAEIIKIARRLGITTLITQVGAELQGVSRKVQHDSIVEGLKKCVPLLEDNGMTLTVEPLNILVDHKGYYLSDSKEGYEITDETGSPNVKLLFDVYHQQITEGNISANLLSNAGKTGHIHIAGNPGRHEPYENSELDYGFVVGKLKQAGYDGAVGLEYFPLRDPMESLKLLFEKMPQLD